jgi:hypothetical protein
MHARSILLSGIASVAFTALSTAHAQPVSGPASVTSAQAAGAAQVSKRHKKKSAVRAASGVTAAPQPPASALMTARAAGANQDVTDPNFSPADLAKKHPAQNWFLRRDPIDMAAFQYLYPTQPLDGKGASFGFTEDATNRSRVVSIQAFSSYVVGRYFVDGDRSPSGPLALSAVAVAPYVWLNGTLTDPRKPSERSALQVGLDAQFEFWRGGLFSLQDIGIRPYVQTDFRGEGQIAGVQALWEPYKEQWNLGARYDMRFPKLVGVLWRVIGEFDSVYVDKPGLTDFTAHTSYAWVGGTLQVKAVLFENLTTVPEWLCGRVVVNGSTNFFWDARSGKSINANEASIGYSFAPSVSNVLCSTGPRHGPQLNPSMSFVYNNGTDKSTLEKREQYKVVLSVQF